MIAGLRNVRGVALGVGLALTAGQTLAGSMPDVFPSDRATHRISVTVTPGLSSMLQLPDLYLRNARERMHKGERLPDAALRQLASLNDGVAAQTYARRLIERPGAGPSDIAYYSAIAVGTGRIWTLPDMIEAMRKLDPATEPKARIRKYIEVLYPHAWAGNGLALDAVIAFNGEGRLFGPLSDATRQRILKQAARVGDGRIELRMALDLLQDEPLGENQARWARTYLDLAAASEHPGIAAAAMAMRHQLDRTADPGG